MKDTFLIENGIIYDGLALLYSLFERDQETEEYLN